MKKNKKFIKRLKARSNRNVLRKKMYGDKVLWINASSADMEGEHPTVEPNVMIDMQGDHPPVNMKGDHPFTDMKGDRPYVKPRKRFAKMQGDHPTVDKKDKD